MLTVKCERTLTKATLKEKCQMRKQTYLCYVFSDTWTTPRHQRVRLGNDAIIDLGASQSCL